MRRHRKNKKWNSAYATAKKFRYAYWSSTSEMIAYARQQTKHQVYYSQAWIGRDDIHSWEEVETALTTQVWEEGAKIVQDMREELEGSLPIPLSIKRKCTTDEFEGDEVDIDRLRLGLPFWKVVKRDTGRHRGKRIQLVFNIAASCVVSPRDIFWRGAICLVLADLLEAAGYRVEIVAAARIVNCYTSNYQAFLGALKVKEEWAPVDIAHLASAISGWSFRTLWFGGIEEKGTNTANGLGQAVGTDSWNESGSMEQEDWDKIGIDENAWIIADAFTRENAFGVLKQILQKYIE